MTSQPYVEQWRHRFRREVVPQLPTYVVLDESRKHRGVIVGIARACADLADYRDGSVSASIETIAQAAGVGRKLVMPVLDYLHVEGVVVVERLHGKRTSTRRRLTIHGERVDLEGPAQGTVSDDRPSTLKVPHAGPSLFVDSPLLPVESPSDGFDGPQRGDQSIQSIQSTPPAPASPKETGGGEELKQRADKEQDAQLVQWLAERESIDLDLARAVLRRAQADPTTEHSPEGRLRKSHEYRQKLIRDARSHGEKAQRAGRAAAVAVELDVLRADPATCAYVKALESSFHDNPNALLAAVRQDLPENARRGVA